MGRIITLSMAVLVTIIALGLGSPSVKAQDMPGNPWCDAKWTKSGKSATYQDFMDRCLRLVHGEQLSPAAWKQWQQWQRPTYVWSQQQRQSQPPQGASPAPLAAPNMNRQYAAIPALAASLKTLKPQTARALAMAPRAPAKSQEDEDIDPRIIRQANRLFPWASQQEQRTQYIIDQMNSAADRQQGNSYSLRIRQ